MTIKNKRLSIKRALIIQFLEREFSWSSFRDDLEFKYWRIGRTYYNEYLTREHYYRDLFLDDFEQEFEVSSKDICHL